MNTPKICLTLTGKTLAEDLAVLDRYRDYVDIAELRADFLDSDERLRVRDFPEMAGIPCILTLRRKIDGGCFIEGEAARTILFARALSFAAEDKRKNFQYVDFEEDFHIPSLQDAALAFGTKIIRSVHDMKNPVSNICERLAALKTTGYEIPKIAFMPHSLDDVKNLFEEAKKLNDNEHILVAMGPLGVPSRILGERLKNFLTYTSAPESAQGLPSLSHMDPRTLCEEYNFKSINSETELFGITGWPLTATSSPALHNGGYKKLGMNCAYIPMRAEKFTQALSFAETIGVKGMSVTIPHKEAVLDCVFKTDADVDKIGASNTIVRNGDTWNSYNTDAYGFAKSLLEFTGLKSLAGKKVAIIGAGGAARAIAYAVKKLRGKACVFNRTVEKAAELAEKYHFKYSALNADAVSLLKKYSSIIIQTTSRGMNSSGPYNEKDDPIWFYNFSGKEILFDIVYVPEVTPVMGRAAEAGCRVCNGYDMLRYQGYRQFELFTGKKYEG